MDGRIHEGHADDVLLPVLARQRPEDRMGPGEVECQGVMGQVDVGARPLGDAQQEDDLAVEHGGGGVEHRDDLE